MARLLSGDLVRRALSGHAALGLLAGALIYILALSGSLIVIHEQWQRWEQPNVAEMPSMAPQVVQRAVEGVLASEAGKPPTSHLYVRMPTEALPRTVVTTDHQAVYVDAAGQVAGPEAHKWTEFLIGMHYYLHLPAITGLTVVGALGIILAALALGGVIAHPRIFRDAFRLRARGPRQLAFADWHNRLAVWTLPFTLAVALTGAMLGLATVLAAVMAAIFYDGDRQDVFAPIFGHEPAHDARSAPVPDVAAALRHMQAANPGITPTYAILHDPGTQGQHVQILGDHPRRLIFGEYYRYDAQGNFQGTVGMADGTFGQQASASTYKLHFGSFGGLPVKLAYIGFGFALMVVTGVGVWLWLMKRRQRGRAAPALEAMWTTILWGTPTLVALACLARMAAGPDAPMTALFWLGLMGMLAVAGFTKNAARCSGALRTTLGALLLAIAAAHLASLDRLIGAMLILDGLLATIGIGLLIYGRRPARGTTRQPGASPSFQAAA